ncbi:MAG: sodium/solute symporter [Flavobacteriia bacterium]|nr:sodium/solute symporter [Flavobacteriia bacterium]OIP46309.1 MAG: sodium/glucose cotransporter [Flavobacteriaceae bacterium CG2_30_31_66]PIV95679.1 MAG: sodium/glucose cotransporter [Flavobacteriaceae bacterium CG17_big_fil_post_rev_8_21_14_2_50_31_13]PIX14481.1 MAG: sodium/glucose cotransporter [Flavobacteriaceae bacterium CG_4_8_14_3_um_filter_31_8]PIY15577.1 MAG: sodium/glucose cotransporter [Flavobacteriaceae bacterium CG_4_10_14_3_um_filter_31_253]PIZ09248.1 MAG: sodium/glucose cotrans
MTAGFGILDYAIFIAYAILILGVGLWVSRDKKGHQKNAEDYFLASKSLPWWAIGASLIAANISAEQFIGMSGSGFALGLAIASYEWMAAITLIIVGKYFLPIFIEKGLYTIPEFVEKRFSTNLKTILAVFWIALYVFVNLASVLYLGGLAIETIMGVDMIYAVIGLALFAAAYSLYGGLSAVAWTDVIQVIFLILGGLVTTYLALNTVSGGEGVFAGLSKVMDAAPDKFHMILDEFNGDGTVNKNYLNLPGIWVLVGGLWVANIYYWGFNQYIIQRTLAAKSLKESQKGILLAAGLKIIIPLIVVIPGIAAYVMVNDPEIMASLGEVGKLSLPSEQQADKAYPWLLQFLPTGLKGVAFAALAAAVVSSLASMLNSTSTIFTMDIYKQYINKNASDKATVNVGRISGVVALVIAVIMAPLLGGIDQAFQFIQEWTGVVSPGILAVFILGLFWKKTTNNAAIWGAILSIPIALALKYLPIPALQPWMHQMGLTAVFTMLVIVLISYLQNKGADDERGISLTKDLFKTSPTFNIGAFIVCIITAVLYCLFW